MGVFGFLKKIFAESKEEIKKDRLDFSEIGNWIENRKKELRIREEKTFKLIRERIDNFLDLFRKKINAAKNFDVGLKKAEDRFKLMSKKGQEEYIELAENFAENLNKLEKNNLKQFSEKIDKLFFDFSKKSAKNYEMATILIGKEMAEIKETLKTFSKDLVEIFEENKDIGKSLNRLSFVESKLNELTKTNEELEEINKTINSLNRNLSEKEEENKKFLLDIEEIKKSQSYLDNLAKHEKIKLLKENLEKELVALRQVINFKELANFYHIFEDKMKLIKGYKENFQREFDRVDGKKILNYLLDESNLNNKEISDKMKKIEDIKNEIKKNEKEIKPDETQGLYHSMTKIILDIGNLKNEKVKLEKRKENLNFSRKELIEEIKDKAEEQGLLLSGI